MEKTISQETSKRITALRFLLIVFVVFIHNCFTLEGVAENFEQTGELIVFKPTVFSKWIQLFISQGIARCAVPLFFLFAAFLQAKKNDNYHILLKKRAKSLLIPYFIWLGLYFLYPHFVKYLISIIKPALLKHPNNIFTHWTALDWLHKFFGYELEKDGELSLPEFARQFWFIRDLLILTVLSPVFKAIIKKFPRGFFALVCILFLIPVRIYFVKTQALFFYIAGLYWGMFDFNLFEKADKISFAESIALFLISFIATYLFFDNTSSMYWIMVLASCLLFLKISKLIINNEKTFNTATYFSGFSFFLFAIHTPVMNEMLKRIWLHFLPMTNGFFCLAEYFGVAFLNIAIGTTIGIALKKLCPRLFAVLTGGR
mgnify:CR=1 FL=1